MAPTSASPPAGTGPSAFVFDEFELRLDSGELFRAEAPVKLQPQPAKVLEILARRTGEVVGREELQTLVWGEGTFLEADANLNFCIKQIRRALNDPASTPRYIETIPRRGYRFLVPVEVKRLSLAAAVAESASLERTEDSQARNLRRISAAVVAGLALVLLALFATRQRAGSPRALDAPPIQASQVSEPTREHYRTALYIRRSDPERARQELKEALLLEPQFAEAHAMLAWVEIRRELPPDQVLPELESTARKAVELGPDLARAHLALGQLLFQYKLDWKNGESELRRSIELDPANDEARHALATLLAGLGKHQEAIASAQRARELNPEGMHVNADLAWFYYLARQYDEAVRQAAKALALKELMVHGGSFTNEDAFFFRWAWRVILYSSLQTGDRRAGLEAARELMKTLGDPAAARRLVRIEDLWRWERQRLLKLSRETWAFDALASNAVAAGQTELAFSYLETACRRKWPNLLLIAAADPLFDPLRGDPRFERFLDCIGVPADAPSRHQPLRFNPR